MHLLDFLMHVVESTPELLAMHRIHTAVLAHRLVRLVNHVVDLVLALRLLHGELHRRRRVYGRRDKAPGVLLVRLRRRLHRRRDRASGLLGGRKHHRRRRVNRRRDRAPGVLLVRLRRRVHNRRDRASTLLGGRKHHRRRRVYGRRDRARAREQGPLLHGPRPRRRVQDHRLL